MEAVPVDFEPSQAVPDETVHVARTVVAERGTLTSIALAPHETQPGTRFPNRPQGCYFDFNGSKPNGTSVRTQMGLGEKSSALVVDPLAQASPRVKSFPAPPRPRERYRVLQRWEGTITQVAGATFVAQLRDLTDPSHPLEVGEFSLDEVHEDDLGLLDVGAVFYWSVGYMHQALGQRRLTSEVRLRRITWTESELKHIDEPSALDQFFDVG